MPSEDFEALSTFIDGETVDPDELAATLAAPEAIDFLIDCARLRQETRAIELPHPALSEEAFGRRARRVPAWLAAAGVAAALLAGMLWLARPTPPSHAETLPEPDQVLRFVPGEDWS